MKRASLFLITFLVACSGPTRYNPTPEYSCWVFADSGDLVGCIDYSGYDSSEATAACTEGLVLLTSCPRDRVAFCTLPVAPPRVATASYYAPITLEVAHQLCNLAGGVTWVD